MTKVYGVHGKEDSPTFLILLGLPNKVAFRNLRVTLGELPGSDILIGMDIISHGDFTITNHKNHTVCSFRTPSQKTIDFVEDQKRKGPRKDKYKSKRRLPGEPKRKRR